MGRVTPPGLEVRPDRSLRKFARTELLTPQLWEELDALSEASEPKTRVYLIDGIPNPFKEAPSSDWERESKLEERLLQEFHSEIASGRWTVKAVPRGKTDRQPIAIEFVEGASKVYFERKTIGEFALVEIAESPATVFPVSTHGTD